MGKEATFFGSYPSGTSTEDPCAPSEAGFGLTWVPIWKVLVVPNMRTTVDGQNPAPVDMVNIPLSTGFYIYIYQVVSRISEPSTVWSHFFRLGDSSWKLFSWENIRHADLEDSESNHPTISNPGGKSLGIGCRSLDLLISVDGNQKTRRVYPSWENGSWNPHYLHGLSIPSKRMVGNGIFFRQQYHLQGTPKPSTCLAALDISLFPAPAPRSINPAGTKKNTTRAIYSKKTEIRPSWWFDSTHLKNIRQIESFPQGSGWK